jgi:DnaJ-class molecular chaperone
MRIPSTDANTARMWDEGFGYITVNMRPDELLCPECEGNGRISCDAGVDGFSKHYWAECDHCDGHGVLEIELLEHEQ